MKTYLNTIKLFCKTPSIIVPYIILLIINNTILIRLYQAFVYNLTDSKAGKADPYFYFSDIGIICCFLLFIFFIFIGYEFMRKTKEVYLEETLIASGNRGSLICLEQLLVLWSAVILVAVNISVYFVMGYVMLSMPSLFIKEMIQMVLVDILLLSLASSSIGFLISKLTRRFVGYTIIICIICFILPNMVSLFMDWQLNLHIPIFGVRDFIHLIPPDSNAVKDPLYGLSLEWYRSAAMLFWVFSSFLLCGWRVFRLRKKLQLIFSVCIIGIMIYMGYGVINKGSILLQWQHPESSLEETIQYYLNHPGQEIKANFEVAGYDMEFIMKRQLSAKVTLTIEADKILPKYLFTLHHGYKISKIMNESGLTLPYMQEGDYVEINNTSMSPIKSLCFTYEGYSSTFYSNSKGCFLPGFFPYYPKAGYRKIYENSYLQAEDREANYRVKVIGQSVLSNLKEEDGILEGRTDNVILIAGHYDKVVTNENVGICYPLQESSYETLAYLNSDEMNKKIKELYDFLGVSPKVLTKNKMIVNIPGSMAFASTLEPYYECKDYVLTDYVEPQDILKNQIKAVGKEMMKEVFFAVMPNFETNPSEITLNKDQEGFEGYEEFTELRDTFVLKMREFGVQYTVKKVIYYLNDEKNNTDSLTFLKNMK